MSTPSPQLTPLPPLWQPGSSERSAPKLAAFEHFLDESRGLVFDSYDALWQWSTTETEEFWLAVWQYFGLDATSARGPVLSAESMPRATWFAGSTVNFAEVLLAAGAPDAAAIVGFDELGVVQTLTRAQLRRQVRRVADELRRTGVQRGDVVAGYLPNIPEAVTAFLAAASIGAIWTSVGQDYAWPAVVARFAQLEPVVLIAADGYRFGGKEHRRGEAVEEIRRALPSIRSTIVVERLGGYDATGVVRSWAAVVAEDDGVAHDEGVAAGPPEAPTDFNDPLWVLFSSGTTGLPKGLVHGHGGILLESYKQMVFHWDLGGDDVVFWYTSPSWVMWNLLVSTLVTGAAIVCYDGSPAHPDPSFLWQKIAELGVTYFGTSPGYLALCRNAGLTPGSTHDLSALRSMGSTGSPLPPDVHQWAQGAIAPIPLWSISGGTDIAGAFVGGVATVPVWPGELSARCLGVALDAWNEAGEPVRDEVGEMVITKPIPSMPLHLWNDPDGTRYVDTYFSTFPGVWRQGDWITITERRTVIIHGRSDSTLNRNGVRMGSADIYAAAESLPQVAESLVLGVEEADGGYWMPLFVRLEEPGTLDPALIEAIRAVIRQQASPRHVPDDVFEVAGIPHTRTGKKLEVPVKRILQGVDARTAVNFDTVDDPSLLDAFIDLARQRTTTTTPGSVR